MPVYTHRCEQGHDVLVVQPMSEEPRTTCEEEGCTATCYRVIRAGKPGFKIPHRLRRTDMVDYREDLARFPNDPEAWVDGPRALAALMDKRKRAGWTFKPVSEADQPKPPPEVDGEKLIRESYEEALKEVNGGD